MLDDIGLWKGEFVRDYQLTSGVLEHKWRASLKTILFLYE